MKEITYNFITDLKELSKKYNFDGFLDVELSPSSFKLHSYYTEFYIHTDAEDFTALMICKLLDDMKELLTKTKYPVNLEYAFSISSSEGTIYNLFDDSYEPTKANRQSNKIEFPCDYEKEEQCYTLSLDRGEITLKKDHDDKEEYFKENPDIIDFLNTFIDNKIEIVIPTTTNNIIKDIRKIRENLKEYTQNNPITVLNFGFHYNNNGLTGVYTSFEYSIKDAAHYFRKLREFKFESDLPSYGLFRRVDMTNYTDAPKEYIKSQIFTSGNKTTTEDKQYFKKVIESFIENTKIKFEDIESAYINLNLLDDSALVLYRDSKTIKLITHTQLLAQIEIRDTKNIKEEDLKTLKINIHKFLYETHGEGCSILVTELEDDDSEYGGISYPGYTLLDFIQETDESFEIIRNKDKLNEDLKDAGIKPLDY